MEDSRLLSLLITYSFEDYDSFGLRAVVPRAIPLNPPFHPSTYLYKIQVPSSVEDLRLDAPHYPDTHVEISGNTNLQFGMNTVQLKLTNLRTGEEVNYVVKVDRKRERGFLLKLASVGTLTSVVIVGAVLFMHRSPKSKKESTESVEGLRGWRRRVEMLLNELGHH